MFEIVYPNNFPKVSNLLSLIDDGDMDCAVQFFSPPIKKLRHQNMISLPFSWHSKQVQILLNQPKGGRLFVNIHGERERYISYMSNARLLGRAVISQDLKINKDTIYHDFISSPDYESFSAQSVKVINEPVFFIGDTIEYFHWIIDCLSSLKLWKESKLDRAVRLFISNDTDFKRKTLEAYGVPHEMILGSTEENIQFNHVFIPSVIGGGQSWGTPLYLPEFHRKSVLHITSKVRDKKYYISRRKTKRRRISNEADIEKLLKKKGFIILYLEEYSFMDQVSLMKSALLVVAPHGAGLTNIVYCEPNTTVIELLCEQFLNRSFYKLSTVSGHKYIPLVSSDYIHLHNAPHVESWKVDISQLEQVVTYCLKRL